MHLIISFWWMNDMLLKWRHLLFLHLRIVCVLNNSYRVWSVISIGLSQGHHWWLRFNLFDEWHNANQKIAEDDQCKWERHDVCRFTLRQYVSHFRKSWWEHYGSQSRNRKNQSDKAQNHQSDVKNSEISHSLVVALKWFKIRIQHKLCTIIVNQLV